MNLFYLFPRLIHRTTLFRGGIQGMKLTLNTILKFKYLNLLVGGIFAILAIIFLLWGLKVIFIDESDCLQLTVPFMGMTFCVLFGLSTIFLEN